MVKLRVAVIGAGGAGLAMSRCLSNEPQLEFVVFEKCDKVGGIWRYTKGTKDENYECHTPMYKNLRTNLPKEVMAYPDFPYPEHLPSFIANQTVTKYLEDFAEHFDLMKYIRLQHEVKLVKLSEDQEHTSWHVATKNLKNGEEKEERFDAVVVANGHFTVPKCPKIPGLDTFPGKVLHSIRYDTPEDFQDQVVVILGGASSGLDLSVELPRFSKKVYFVHKGKKTPHKLSQNVEEIIGTVTACFPDGFVEFNGEDKRSADALILCTGYHYSFPFLAPECKIRVVEDRVTSLYKHVFNTAYPSMSFLGLCIRLCPFLTFSIQAQWVASVLSGRTKLPAREEMVEDEERDYQEQLKAGLPSHKMHTLGYERLFEYNTELSRMAGVASAYSPAIHSLYGHTSAIRLPNLTTYRNTNFAIKGDQWYEV